MVYSLQSLICEVPMKNITLALVLTIVSLKSFSRVDPEAEVLRCVSVEEVEQSFSLYETDHGYQYYSETGFYGVKIGQFQYFKGEITKKSIDLSTSEFGVSNGSLLGSKEEDEELFEGVSFNLKYNSRYSESFVPKLESLENIELNCSLIGH